MRRQLGVLAQGGATTPNRRRSRTGGSSGRSACLGLVTTARCDIEENQFVARTTDGRANEEHGEEPKPIPIRVERVTCFLYLRTIRTDSRALSLARATLLENILRMKEAPQGHVGEYPQRTRIAGPTDR